MNSNEHKAVVTKFIDEILNQGKLSRLHSLVHPDFRFHGMPDTETLEDLKLAFAYLHINWTTIYHNVHFEINNISVENNIVTVEITRKGILNERYGATQSPNEVNIVKQLEQYRIVDGKIKERWINHLESKREPFAPQHYSQSGIQLSGDLG